MDNISNSSAYQSVPVAGSGFSSFEYECSQYAVRDSSITDWSKPVTRCIAGDYSSIAVNSVVYNKQTLTDDIWIELPASTKQFSISGVYQIHPSSECKPEKIPCVKYRNIWLRIPVHLVDTSVGQKIYRVEFKHKCSLENMSLYFSYTIQDDNPPKPYVYMK